MPSLLHSVVRRWAEEHPRAAALIQASSGREVAWKEFDETTSRLAGALARLGFQHGDFLAASLPMTIEHVLLEYACFKLGVIHAPLDLRLPAAEVARSLTMIRAKGFACIGDPGAALRESCPFVEHWIPFPDGYARLMAESVSCPGGDVDAASGAQVIFTTGSTGAPKPALLSHRNITAQNAALGEQFGFSANTRILANLPASHVGGQAEVLMTALYVGGTAVLMEMFDPARSLEAIERYRINILGQIPAMFNLEWRLSNYAGYDLKSLETAVYGGQQAPRAFLDRLAAMAPRTGTGLGLTEAAGFCTYTPTGANPDAIYESIGLDHPSYPMSIREPMTAAGAAGGEVPDGAIGHVCFRGPQTFLGYVNDPESTIKSISSDDVLYTGDMGFRDAKGLHFAGRAKWVIKPRGYQVFPGDVESHFCRLEDRVLSCGAVGVEHAIFSEGIVAFIEKKPGAELNVAALRQHARGMAAYMRPLHYVLLDAGGMPLNRVAKIDYVRLQEMAIEEVAQLRARRRWDR